MNTPGQRGNAWWQALTAGAEPLATYAPSLRVADAPLGDDSARYIAVVPDPHNPFPRARHGETGLIEGWSLAKAVRDAIEADCERERQRPIVAVIDTPSQAYGRNEEAYGIHQALAAAADAYATARLHGHPIVALLVGKAMSGAFLAHGYQANRLIALNDPQVMVHAMGRDAAARITLRSVDELDALAADIPPMAYDIHSYASLGLLWKLLDVADSGEPGADAIAKVAGALRDAVADIRNDASTGLESRLHGPLRKASAEVRARLRAQWR
ncbi:biotin-independent malonate decarboxylase subunit gamma [Dyella sp. 2RAB6]|uniref:biotin-independent malonate decarboxylase subunit gamma n=1 Tax=Dyella sp. 2RAB6 TaxID=3232992 RepID=UPI003F8DB21E